MIEDVTTTLEDPTLLDQQRASTYAEWFACLAEPMRVRMLQAIAITPSGAITVGVLADQLGISQSTASHHLHKLADVGFVILTKRGTSTMVSVNAACCTGLPHAADVVMGSYSQPPCCPTDLPGDVQIRAMNDRDFDAVRRIYAEGIATKNATFETTVPSATALKHKWLPDHRWVAIVEGQVAGWAAVFPVSDRTCYSGVGETSVYVGEGLRGRGVGKTLLHKQVNAADDAGLWTLQTSVFPENRASIALHHSAGFRTLGLRDRIAQLDGVWRDTVFLERRSDVAGALADIDNE
jgi:L-amino acid N-acyltransferase YncA/DNA-binding transcriptional ArsR family regulator